MVVIRLLNMNKIKHVLKGTFLKNVITLLSGTVVAQALPILVSPIITKLYTPKEFGLFALFSTIMALLAVIANGRYQFAINLPKDDHDAKNVFGLAVSISVIVACILLIIIGIFNDSLLKLLKVEYKTNFLYFIPISIVLLALFQVISYWNIRHSRFKILAFSRAVQAVIVAFFSILFGIFRLNSIGLFWGYLLGLIAVNISLVLNLFKIDSDFIKEIKRKSMLEQANRYKKFPIYSMPADFINVFVSQILILFVNRFYGLAMVGFIALSQRILQTPISMISAAILDVFKDRASREYRENGNCEYVFNQTFKLLFIISIVPFILLFALSPYLFQCIFGSEWRIAGEFARYLLIMYMFGFFSSPLTYMYTIAEKQKEDFLLHIYIMISSLLVIFLAYKISGDLKVILLSHSINYSSVYGYYLFRSYKLSKGEQIYA